MRRLERFINNEWRFAYGEHRGEENTNIYNEFYHIGLPHSFTTPYKGESEFYVGYGVYVKELTAPIEWLDKRILIEFGAVFQVAEVFLNGILVARHEGGYTAFVADISGKIVEGANVLTVRVNNIWSPIIAPRAGEHTFAGGIYRDVKLIVTDVACIDWYGVGVTTPVICSEYATVLVNCDTVNCIGESLTTKIFDRDNEIVAQGECEITADNITTELRVENPTLWDCDNPYLYRVVTEVGSDRVESMFGIRYFEWDNTKGFSLNGKRVLIQGANVHQDHGGWGDAVTHAGIARDVKMMKDCGMNFIRGSHYPHHTVFAEECDKQGVLFWSESVFWGIGGFCDEGYWDSSAMPTKPEYYNGFEESLRNTLKEMIKTNRNHPSIVAWSMGNEIFFSKREVMNDAKNLVSRLVDYSHALDSTRPAAIGGVQREGFDLIGDIAGYNGDGAVLYHSPKLPNIVAEYGSIASYRPGKYSLNLSKGADEMYDWRSGRVIWCGYHHGSIANIGNLGIVDLYRLPLRAWYAYREKMLGIAPPIFPKEGKPTKLRISVDRKVMTADGTEDCMMIIDAVNANGNKVSCDINVKLEVLSGGALLPCGRIMEFSKGENSFYDGACAIEVRSYYGGFSTLRASSEGVESDEIELNFLGETRYAGQDIILPQEPSFRRRKVGKGGDIIANRPINFTSELTRGMAKNISDGDSSTYWQPSPSDKVPLITIDLENLYSDFSVEIELVKRHIAKIKVIASPDNKEWVEVKNFTTRRFKSKYKFKVKCGEFRFLRFAISNVNEPIAIRHIKAWQN